MIRRPSPFARAVRTHRVRHGMSQATLAREAGISARHLSCIESGKAIPGREVVYRLIGALALSAPVAAELAHVAGYAAPIEPPADAHLHRLFSAMAEHPSCLVDEAGEVHATNGAFDALLAVLAPPERIWSACVGGDTRTMQALLSHPHGLAPFLLDRRAVLAAFEARCRGRRVEVVERYRVRGRELAFRTVVAWDAGASGGVRMESYVPADAPSAAFVTAARLAFARQGAAAVSP